MSFTFQKMNIFVRIFFLTNPGSSEKCSQRILANLHESASKKRYGPSKCWHLWLLAAVALPRFNGEVTSVTEGGLELWTLVVE